MKPSKETIIQIKFANKEAAHGFAEWLCEAGEQDYWQYQQYRELEKEGDITAIEFHFNGEDNKGKFMCDDIIRTTTGRLDKI